MILDIFEVIAYVLLKYDDKLKPCSLTHPLHYRRNIVVIVFNVYLIIVVLVARRFLTWNARILIIFILKTSRILIGILLWRCFRLIWHAILILYATQIWWTVLDCTDFFWVAARNSLLHIIFYLAFVRLLIHEIWVIWVARINATLSHLIIS